MMDNNEDLDINSILDRLNKNLQDSPEKILFEFSERNWSDWIDDILTYGFANPISNLTSEGDVLVDIIDYLREKSIPLNQYEEAIIILVNQFDFEHSDPNILERLLNALVNIRGRNSNDTLMRLVVSRDNNFVKGKVSFIKSLALLAMAKSVKNDDRTSLETYNYIRMVGLEEMVHDPVFYGNALRFTSSHHSLKDFFDLLSHIFNILQRKCPDIDDSSFLLERHIKVLLDKFEELHYQDIGRFYSELSRWLTKVLISESFLTNSVFNRTIKEFAKLMLEYPFVKEMFIIVPTKKFEGIKTEKPFIEYEYALLTRVLSSIYAKSNKRLSNYDILHAVAFIVKEVPEKVSFIKRFLEHNNLFLKRFYDVLPDMAYCELYNDFSPDVIEKVRIYISDALYSSKLTEKLPKDIYASTNNFLKIFSERGEEAIKELLI